MAETIRTGPVTITIEEGDIAARLERLVPAAADVSVRVANLVVDNARRQWPVSGDSTPSREQFSVMDNRDGTATVRNASPYATEIRGGALVQQLLDEPLKEASQALGEAAPELIGGVLRG